MNERLLYSQDHYPVFQNRMYPKAQAARDCLRGTIRIVENLKTGLVHNSAFDPLLVAYDQDYQNEQANSAAFLDHLEQVRSIVLARLGKRELVEVGCGKAYFLEMLQAGGAEVAGFDPTYEGTNPGVEKRYFTPEIGIQGKGIILRHVLEHVQDPSAFLTQLAKANGHRGLIYIEVPCLDWIIRNRAWFDIYYEHVNYFRLSDFARMFEDVIECGHLFGDQYIYAVADLSTIRRPRRDDTDPVVFPADFAKSVEMLPASDRGDPRVVWGGASKGVIFALLAERAGIAIDRVIDINPAKQGAFLAATGLEVLSPKAGLRDLRAGAPIYVMNPNYLDEIRAMTGHKYTYIGVGNDRI